MPIRSMCWAQSGCQIFYDRRRASRETIFIYPLKEYIADNLVDGKPSGRIKDILKHAPNLEFETKDIKIPAKLYTAKGRTMAKEKIKYMAEFFACLRSEIVGER